MVAKTVAEAGILKGLQVLVVDKDADITSLVGEVLVDAGASVVPANSGTAAITLITLMKFDLVIMELAMPQPDGFKIIEFLGATEPGLLRRTLVLTGRKFDRDAMDRLRNLGIPCLFKPFQLNDLVGAALRISVLGWPLLPAA